MGLDQAWIEDTARRAAATLRARVQDAPYPTLGLAMGLGAVIGGGLWRPVARALVGVGARLALTAVVPALIDGIRWPTENDPDETADDNAR